MNNEMTGWFASGTLPARSGVYETQHGLQYFSADSQAWFGYEGSVKAAIANFLEVFHSSYQSPKWRGFTTEQKG